MCSLLADRPAPPSLRAKPLVIIIMGPPGAGKGTHAFPLSEHLGLPHISTGDLFREKIRNKTPLGLLAKSFIDIGKLVPDDVVLDMLFERIVEPDCKRGYILDGFPRTLAQAEALDQRLGSEANVLVLYFSLEDAILIDRIAGRIACKKCGRPYHVRHSPSMVPGSCDICSGELFQREDDREEVVRKRLEVYRNQTGPAVAYYARVKSSFHLISSEGTKEQIFQSVLSTVKAVI